MELNRVIEERNAARSAICRKCKLNDVCNMSLNGVCDDWYAPLVEHIARDWN